MTLFGAVRSFRFQEVLSVIYGMIQTSMLDIASMGELSLRCHGVDHDGLRELVGPPSSWGPQKTREKAEIWRFGNVEFHFSNWKVYLIFSDHDDLTDGGRFLRIDPWIVRRGLERDVLQVALFEAGIACETIIPDYDPTQRLVRTQSGAVFTFNECSLDGESGLVAWSMETRSVCGERA